MGFENTESTDGNISLKVKAPENSFTGGLKTLNYEVKGFGNVIGGPMVNLLL